MGLFNLFNKKNPATEIKDLVWISEQAKLDGCMALVKENREAIWIAWFADTQAKFNQYLNEQKGLGVEIKLAKTVSLSMVIDKPVFFLEHYPLQTKEGALMLDWKAKQVFVLNSLDEPLFKEFGGEQIIQTMKNMGMKEEESLEHSMISKSIVNAQSKIEKKLIVENSANSQKEWFRRNIIA